jgi:PhnB protein
VGAEHYHPPHGFSLSLHFKNTAEAERIFQRLSKDGRVTMPLEKTFWAERFGMVVDQFGVSWMINCEGPAGTPSA